MTADRRRRAPRTIVSFHAHPDDEALLTAGTLARASAEGHRVVLVLATAGEAGLADDALRSGADLGERRTAELDASAAAVGAARVEMLGYADSGWAGAHVVPPRAPEGGGPVRFCDAPVEEAAARLAALLREERADVLTVYDAFGGYGHVDHVAVHHVGLRAARLAGTPVVLEATVDRRLVLRGARLLRAAGRVLPVPEVPDLSDAYLDRADLTHRVDVRTHWAAKRRALAAHHTQASGGPRTLSLLTRLPLPLARLLWGHEWFRQVLPDPGPRSRRAPLLDDVLAALV